MTLTACVSTPDKKENPYLLERAESYMASGVEYYQHYDYLSARAQFTKALYEYQGFNDVLGIARCRLNLAKLAIALGEYEEASNHLSLLRQLIASDKLNDLLVHADIMSASIAIKLKDYDLAMRHLTPHLSRAEELKNQNAAVHAAIILNRARIAFGAGENQQYWVDQFQKAVLNDDANYRARLLRFKASLLVLDQQYDESSKLLNQALDLYRQQANPKGVSSTLQALGQTKLKQQDSGAAARHYENALLASFKIRDKSAVSGILDALSAIYLKLDKMSRKKNIDQLKSLIIEKDIRQWHMISVPGT